MTSEDKYLMGVLWKFGTIKPGTSQFVFQSYDKVDQMEYIRSRLAPSKEIKITTRTDPRTGNEKVLYRLNFTNKEWAERVKTYCGTNAGEIADLEFVRGFFETRGNVNGNGKNKQKRYTINARVEELKIVQSIVYNNCGVSGAVCNIHNSGRLSYGIAEFTKLMSFIGKHDSRYWNDMIKKMNPDD